MSYIKTNFPYVIIIAAVVLMCGFSFWQTATRPAPEQIAAVSAEDNSPTEPVNFEALIRSKENEFGFRLIKFHEVDKRRINPRIVMEMPQSKESTIRVLKEIHGLSLVYFQSLPELKVPGFTNTLVYRSDSDAEAFDGKHVARLQTFSNELEFNAEIAKRIDWNGWLAEIR